MLKYSSVKTIDVDEWDALVEETYGRPYRFQQQDGCKSRGSARLSVSSEETYGYDNDTLPEVCNGKEMGVSFKAWLAADPERQLIEEDSNGYNFTSLWWERNFYPDVEEIAKDLLERGLVEEGEYVINIDW